jgi:peptidoglycan hydrolase-like protein with peptidoglycan-binding domain
MAFKKLSSILAILMSTTMILQSVASVFAAQTQSINSQKFSEIKGHWAEEQIVSLVNSGVIKGEMLGNKLQLKPNEYITRAEFISILVSKLNLAVDNSKIKKFTDVKSNLWYAVSVNAAVSNGITNGYPDGTFKPQNLISRAEISGFLAKALKLKLSEASNVKKPYTDVNLNDWYFQSVLACNNEGLMKGYDDGKFWPKNKATRAEAFVIIYNIGNNKAFAKPEVSPTPTKKPEASPTPTKKPEPTAVPTIAVNTENKLVSRGEERIQYDLKPVIKIGQPFASGSNYLETKDGQIKIEGSVFGNILQKIDYSILNDNGTGNKISVVNSVYPEITSVRREVYTAKVDWSINLKPLKDDLNIISFYVKDVYGNEASTTMKVMRFIDSDGDGLSNFDERAWGTNYLMADTDGDGLSDSKEVRETLTSPLKKDSDGDGLSDYDEVVTLGWKTSPLNSSTIGSGINDSELDLDGDGISNKDEITKYFTNPTSPDSDGDGLPDGIEVFEYNSNPKLADSNSNGITDIIEVENRTLLNVKIERSKIKLPTNSFGIYGLPENEDIDAKPVKAGDKRVQIVQRIQYMLNRILVSEGKENKTCKLTGIFDNATLAALYEVFALNEINKVAFDELVKRVKAMDKPEDVLSSEGSYLGYSPDEKNDGVKEIKYILERWRQSNAPQFKALYSIPSLLENDGSMNGAFDTYTAALLKLFQLHNGLKATGKVNDATAQVLLSSLSNWKINKSLIKNDIFFRESFGKNSFYRYYKDSKIPLNPVYYSQLYGPWSKDPYYAIKRGYSQGGRVIQRNGCGPTATAMVVATLADRSVDPGIMAKFSMEKDCVAGYDTEGTLYPRAADEYGLKIEYSSKIDYVKEYLKDGKHLGIASNCFNGCYQIAWRRF